MKERSYSVCLDDIKATIESFIELHGGNTVVESFEITINKDLQIKL